MKDNSNDIKQAEELFDFIKNSPSCYHVIANLKNMLNEQGFIELMENEIGILKMVVSTTQQEVVRQLLYFMCQINTIPIIK